MSCSFSSVFVQLSYMLNHVIFLLTLVFCLFEANMFLCSCVTVRMNGIKSQWFSGSFVSRHSKPELIYEIVTKYILTHIPLLERGRVKELCYKYINNTDNINFCNDIGYQLHVRGIFFLQVPFLFVQASPLEEKIFGKGTSQKIDSILSF